MVDSRSEILDASGFVLAGGQSNRFGEDKALFTVNGKPLIQRPIACLMGLVSSLAIIAKEPDRYSALGIPVVEDGYPQRMPHVGVLTGLETAESPWSVFLACDMPSITPDEIRTLYEARRPDDDAESVQAVVPDQLLGRAMSVIMSGATVMTPIGALVGGAVAATRAYRSTWLSRSSRTSKMPPAMEPGCATNFVTSTPSSACTAWLPTVRSKSARSVLY